MPFNGLQNGLNTGLKHGLTEGLNKGLLHGPEGLNTGQPYDQDAWKYIQGLRAAGEKFIDEKVWNNHVIALKQRGIWQQCDYIAPIGGITAGGQAVPLKAPSGVGNIVWNGTLTHTSMGVIGDGSTGYGNTGFIPRTMAKEMTINSSSCGAYVFKENTIIDVPGAPGFFYGCQDGTEEIFFSSNYAPGGLFFALNDTGWSSGSFTPYVGFISQTRNSSSANHVNWNGVPNVYSNTEGSVNLPTVAMYVIASNNSGTANGFTNAGCSYFYFGSSNINQSDLFFEVNKLQRQLGRQIY
jgi:hypothetical protein